MIRSLSPTSRGSSPVWKRLKQLLDEFDAIILRDKIWSQHVYGWHGHLYQILAQVADDGWPNNEFFVFAWHRCQAELRLLKLEFALRLWKAEHGTWPESLDQLVPAILPAVPLDPYDPAGKPLRYNRTDEGFLLYSVGQNGVDDGGKLLDRETYWSEPSVGDFQLEGLFAPDPFEEPEAEDEAWEEEFSFDEMEEETPEE